MPPASETSARRGEWKIRRRFHPLRRLFLWALGRCLWLLERVCRALLIPVTPPPVLWSARDLMPVAKGVVARLIQAGRELNTHVIVDTQRPELANPSITGSATELVCFRLLSPDSLRAVERLGMPRERNAALPLGSFVVRNQLSGGLRAGRLF